MRTHFQGKALPAALRGLLIATLITGIFGALPARAACVYREGTDPCASCWQGNYNYCRVSPDSDGVCSNPVCFQPGDSIPPEGDIEVIPNPSGGGVGTPPPQTAKQKLFGRCPNSVFVALDQKKRMVQQAEFRLEEWMRARVRCRWLLGGLTIQQTETLATGSGVPLPPDWPNKDALTVLIALRSTIVLEAPYRSDGTAWADEGLGQRATISLSDSFYGINQPRGVRCANSMACTEAEYQEALDRMDREQAEGVTPLNRTVKCSTGMYEEAEYFGLSFADAQAAVLAHELGHTTAPNRHRAGHFDGAPTTEDYQRHILRNCLW